MEEIKVKGIVQKKLEALKITESFSKQTIVIKTDEKYPQMLPIDFVNDNISRLDNINIMDEITVSINLRGKEWTSDSGKHGNTFSAQGWKIEKV